MDHPDRVDSADKTDVRRRLAAELMLDFAARTGLSSDQPTKRYLWTDAFAVCNFLGLARELGDPRHQELALGLVQQVHQVLGRHRGDGRTGWLSGLSDDEGQAHPTQGGLRIGKQMPERRPEEPFDQHLEWERDGQYFHYLTKWMHALDRTAAATRQPLFHRWARELAETAFRSFVFRADAVGGHAGRPIWRMVWKMSIDLSRPLVQSMGYHDPLDGYLTFKLLQGTELPRRAGANPERALGALDDPLDAGPEATLDTTLDATLDTTLEGGSRRWPP